LADAHEARSRGGLSDIGPPPLIIESFSVCLSDVIGWEEVARIVAKGVGA
jgi:hypothetical protein